MSRSGYTDDNSDNLALINWRGAVKSALRGKRGQAFLRELASTLDAMPDKRLSAGSFKHENGCHCTLGVVGAARGIDMTGFDRDPDDIDTTALGSVLGIAPAMAQEIMFLNDEAYGWECRQAADPDTRRWELMREWVGRQLKESTAATTA
jgi:hypothetical protein